MTRHRRFDRGVVALIALYCIVVGIVCLAAAYADMKIGWIGVVF